jgi:hypothetical protein
VPDLEAPLPEAIEQQPEEDAPTPRMTSPSRDLEAPEADALEQAAVVTPTTEHRSPRIDPEVPEADAIDQATLEFEAGRDEEL